MYHDFVQEMAEGIAELGGKVDEDDEEKEKEEGDEEEEKENENENDDGKGNLKIAKPKTR